MRAKGRQKRTQDAHDEEAKQPDGRGEDVRV